MPYCSSCGLPIPEGQGSSCSMCYGDPYHGRDGYYLQQLEEEQQRETLRQEEETREYEEFCRQEMEEQQRGE
jgi:hypothetical protein